MRGDGSPRDRGADVGPRLDGLRRKEPVRAGGGVGVRDPLEDEHAVAREAADLAGRGGDDGAVGGGDGEAPAFVLFSAAAFSVARAVSDVHAADTIAAPAGMPRASSTLCVPSRSWWVLSRLCVDASRACSLFVRTVASTSARCLAGDSVQEVPAAFAP